MISGIVPFYEIVESVKDETGIKNMRPLYDKIRRLIFRAERIIGCGGSVRLKKKVYTTNGQLFFRYPEDLVEIEGVGYNCHQIASCDIKKREDGFRLREAKDKVVLLYWALNVDDEGNPVVTRNHEEAVVAFIVWKLYSSRAFLGLGNFNMKKDYEYIFNSEVGAARGNDAFPTLEEYAQIAELSTMDRRLLFKADLSGYNYCDDGIPTDCEDGGGDTPTTPTTIYYWQETSLSTTLEDIVSLFQDNVNTFFDGKPSGTEQQFSVGYDLNLTSLGKIAIGVKNATNSDWSIYDVLGNNVTAIFEMEYDSVNNVLFFYSNVPYTPNIMNLKIKRN